MIEESILELDKLEEEFTWLVCEEPCRDIAVLLEDLLIVHGSAFVNQLKLITAHRAFYPVKGETEIYSTGGERGEDYENLLNAARKAVEHGYRVFILPNPRGVRTADKRYFEKNTEAKEVLVLKGKKIITVNREDTLGESYIKNFLKKYKK